MSIKEALAQIDASEQRIPSNPLANTGLSDAVTWAEVREWLASHGDHQAIPEDAIVIEYSWGTYYETATRIWIEPK